MAKILIIDDDIQIVMLLKKFLTSAGHQAAGLSDSSKAMEAAKSLRPDLFILDLMMPQPDGFKLCKMLRADPGFSKSPILIITAMDISNSDATIFGANGYLAKPFNFDELVANIDNLLDTEIQ